MTYLPTSVSPVPRRSSWTVYVSWALILICVAYVFFRIFTKSKADSDAMDTTLQLQCRYVVGYTRLLPAPADPLVQALRRLAKTPSDRVALTPAIAEVGGKEIGVEYLEETPDANLSPETRRAKASLMMIYRDNAKLSPDDAEQLSRELDWSGKLALTWGLPDDDPLRAPVLSAAKRTASTFIGAFVVILVLLGLGVIAGITALVLRLTGYVQPIYLSGAPPLAAYVEGFALFLVLYVASSFARPLLEPLGVAGLLLLQAVIFLPMLWPVLRGVRWNEYLHAIGWHRGAGVLKEIGCGLIGYLSGLPIVALCLATTFFLVWLTNAEQPVHPIAGKRGGGIGDAILLYLAAAVLAPLVEETLFRGMLYHHVRSRFGWILSAIFTGLLFAAIHPQGWAAIPVLGSIGFVLAMIREWRASLIGPITAHAFNNGMVVTLLLLATR